MLKEKNIGRQTRIEMHFNFMLVIRHGEIENEPDATVDALNMLPIFLSLT
jgi:hypothetical protein